MALTGIREKVVLITGASGSVGSATAVEFARLGAKLALTGRDEDKLKATAKRCHLAGTNQRQVFIVTGDITDEESVTKIVKKTVGEFGGIDILVTCAGIIRSGGLSTTTLSDYDEVFKTNVKGTFLVCQQAIPHILKNKGNIVIVSSLTGIRPAFDYFPYTIAEAGLDQMTRAMALELGPQGVRVNSVNPAVIEGSDLWIRDGAPFANNPEKREELQNNLPKTFPLRRLAKVEDVAKAITFLSSRQAAFVAGVALPVDGGKILTSKPPRVAAQPKT